MFIRIIRSTSMAVALAACVLTGALASQKATKSKETKSPMDYSKATAVIETSMGTIEIQFYPKEAPKAVENFIRLAQKGYYNGVIFHRVIDNFMIQGGDPTGTGRGGESIYGKPFEDEFSPSLRHDSAGVVSMANSGPGTNGSQFFITLVPTPWLNDRHTIFGHVVKGMDVVKAIGKVETTKPGDKPVKDVVMKKVTIKGLSKEQPKAGSGKK